MNTRTSLKRAPAPQYALAALRGSNSSSLKESDNITNNGSDAYLNQSNPPDSNLEGSTSALTIGTPGSDVPNKGIPGSAGLVNIGNSCYMNCVIQCLVHAAPLTEYILQNSEQFDKDINKSNPLGSGGRVAEAYACLLKAIWSGHHSCISPQQFKFTIASFAKQFNNTHQHDAQELAAFLLDGIHEDLNRVKLRQNPITKSEVTNEIHALDDTSLAIKTWKHHLLRNDSIIVDRFQGMHRTSLQCPYCDKQSTKFDIFSSLSLTLVGRTDSQPIELDSCLQYFSRKERLDDRNAWYCTNCKENVNATKSVQLWSTPDILILHLKRFTYQSSKRYGGVRKGKIEDVVNFPVEHLDLEPYIIGPVDPNAPPSYKLFGVVEHSGQTADSGHYTATVQNSKDGRFYKCNDSQIGDAAANFDGVEAYLLFYRRTKGAGKWGGMEVAMESGHKAPKAVTDEFGFTMVTSKKKKKKVPIR
jgi:ubiquitin carboxyl-terminal hydrolase 8